jgi:hypothetical protein
MVTYRMIPLLTSHLGKAPVVEDGRDIGVVYDKKRFDEFNCTYFITHHLLPRFSVVFVADFASFFFRKV